MNGRKLLRGAIGAIGFVVLFSIGVFIFARMNDEDFSPEFLAELNATAPPDAFKISLVRTAADLAPPVRLEADGQPIDIGKLSDIAHAGPWIANVDGDGDRDLLVGDFPGYFWLFENTGTEEKPVYAGRGKLQAGGVDAKTPVY
jgi:hypothetical protein